ncbi:MAG TPA: tetratricopeptide repeat protein [Sphingobacteriaceae bacterium]|nr:tetratricopeptide repeat protein [Sphingobacteriaceae bacterium]
MKIKSFMLALIITGGTVTAFAQKSELSSAKSNYDKYAALKQVGSTSIGSSNLKTAREAIDKAVVHEKTMNDPSAWTYKALIYTDLAVADTIPATSQPFFNEASAALIKAKELDKAGANKKQFDNLNDIFSQYHMNTGVRAYQASKFKDAYTAFNNSLTYRPGDTTVTYYAGLSAINANDYKSAIKSYEQLLKTNFSTNNKVYLDLSKIYAMEKDTAAAIRVASEGATKFSNDPELATQEIELNLLTGKQKSIIGKITAQSEKQPKNKLYPFYLGIAYASANNPDKAEESYKKAIAIDPEFTDATLNLGGVILNKGIDLYNAASKLPQTKQKEYDGMIKKAMAEFDRALPYLEKATTLNPKSRMGWENLKTFYLVKRNDAKVAEITKVINGL